MNELLHRSLLLGLTLSFGILLLQSCPGGQEADGQRAEGEGVRSGALAPATPEAPGADSEGRTQEDPPTQDPPNPRPDGENWIWTPHLRVRVGQTFDVQYKLPQADGGKSLILLVPEHVAAAGYAANDAEDVAHASTVDAAEAAVNLLAVRAGRFRLRLFPAAGADSQMLAESPVLTVEQWPLGNLELKKPPYLTINAIGVKEGQIRIDRGFPVIVYYEVPPGYTDSAWIGVIPASVKSPQESDNAAADVQRWQLDGIQMGQFIWMSDRTGDFVFRLFPAAVGECDYSAQSEEFSIVEPARGKS